MSTVDHTLGPEIVVLAVGFGLLYSLGCVVYDRYKARRRARRLRSGPVLTLPNNRQERAR